MYGNIPPLIIYLCFGQVIVYVINRVGGEEGL